MPAALSAHAEPTWIWIGIPCLAFCVSWLVVRWIITSSWSLRVADIPNARSLHAHPVPRLGGLGVILGGLLLPWLWLPGHTSRIVIPALLLVLISLVDDLRDLSALTRLGAHLLAAALLLCLAPPLPDLWMYVVALGAIGWMTNLYNFMDGANGLAGGVAVIGFAALVWPLLGSEQPALALLAASLAAAAAGFLCFNFGRARIFLGDVGSVPLGFCAAGLALLGWQSGAWSWWFPLLVFAPYITDASVTLLRRALRGVPVWQAHREHYYQRLVLMGWSHRRVAILYYLAMAAATLTAYLAWLWPAVLPWGGLAVAASLVLGGVAIDRAWGRHAR